jgi:hypothetical protein
VTLEPVFNFDKLMVEFPGTVMLSRTIEVQDATAAGMAEYVVTWHTSEGVPVATGTVVVGELVTMTDGGLVTTTEEAAVTVADGVAVVGGAAVGFPPFRQVQALEILSGTLDQRAAYAGKV